MGLFDSLLSKSKRIEKREKSIRKNTRKILGPDIKTADNVEARLWGSIVEQSFPDFVREFSIDRFKRKSLEGRSPLEIFLEYDIKKQDLEKIFNIYGNEIVSQFNDDSYLRNATVLRIDEKFAGVFAPGGIQDHVTDYTIEDFYNIYERYLRKEKLSETEQCILVGLLIKTSDLIGLYGLQNLYRHQDFIKSEISLGIFKDIICSNKKYTNRERRRLVALSKVWSAEDMEKYNNLSLLRKRIMCLPQTKEREELIQRIDSILGTKINDIAKSSDEIKCFMNDVYLDYEIDNRNNIIDNIFDPEEGKRTVVISDISQLNAPALLHFFNPNEKISTFGTYVERIEQNQGRKIKSEERKAMRSQYEAKENRFIPNYAIDLRGIGQIETYGTKYFTNTSNQLSTMLSTAMNLVIGTYNRSDIALGFSKKTLDPELIATSSSRNIHSNKGIGYVESNNQFLDFSASMDEMVSDSDNRIDNTEVVLFRNSSQCTLKPSYVLYVASGSIYSNKEKSKIKEVKRKMKSAGLNVPLVIIDRFSIKSKLKKQGIDIRERVQLDYEY